jgi:hypothetical protein
MAGNTANAALWQGADVFVNDTVGTAGPAAIATPWPATWKAAGLLDGDEGFSMERDEDSNDYYAWGGILVKRTKSKHKRTIKFVALEDNDVTFALINPGSTRTTATGLTSSVIKVPRGREFAIGFEMRDGNKIKRRWVKRAEVDDVGEVKEAESELTVFEITVVIYPESDGTLYNEVEGVLTSGT